MAALAEPADQAIVLVGAVLILGALGASSPSCCGGASGAGSGICRGASREWLPPIPRLASRPPVLQWPGIFFPGRRLAIEQVELAKFSSRNRTMFTLERLTLAGSGGVVVLDPALMRNGHLIIGNAWRRMRLAGPGGTV